MKFFSNPIRWSENGLREGDLREGKSSNGYPPSSPLWPLMSTVNYIVRINKSDRFRDTGQCHLEYFGNIFWYIRIPGGNITY